MNTVHKEHFNNKIYHCLTTSNNKSHILSPPHSVQEREKINIWTNTCKLN